jgi:hypothetical protein
MDRYKSDFISEGFSAELMDNVVKATFPELNFAHRKLLHGHLFDIIDTISIKFDFDYSKRDQYYGQFRQNNYRDSISLLNIILPFIDDTKDKKLIRTLNDIYVRKERACDINKTEPKYTFSNIQYGRCKRGKTITEIQFSPSHLEHNVKLLKNTIQTVGSKLFVNWIDVQPVMKKEFKSSRRIRETNEKITEGKLKEWDVYSNDIEGRLYRGFTPEDIYNVIVSEYFEKVKNIKWLLYDAIIPSSDVPVPYIIIIQDILPIDTALSEKDWTSITSDQQNKFKLKWRDFIRSSKERVGIGMATPSTVKSVLKSLVYFYNKYSGNLSDAIKSGYKMFPIKSLAKDDDEELNKISFSTIIDASKSLKAEFLYNFIVDQMAAFNKSYYGLLFREDGWKTLTPYKKLNYGSMAKYGVVNVLGGKGLKVSLKNRYNFAKSLSHEEREGNYYYYGNRWVGLTDLEKKTVLERINMHPTDSKLMSWFNISRYLADLDPTIRDQEKLKQHHMMLFNYFRVTMADTVADLMRMRGTFTRFTPNPLISDNAKSKCSSSKCYMDKISELVFTKENVKEWNECGYFINNIPYESMGPYKVAKNGKVISMTYFEYMSSEQFWYTTYAMNWISQISFFHRYMNNRILFVTGSTGVGKSTQVPKLLLYALKAIDYNDKGKIVCTQPRIPPTVGNASRISNELGTPIYGYDDRLKRDVRQDNYTVQFKHQFKNHMMNSDELILKIVTDGTLYLELKNPLLKKRIYDKKTDSYNYQERNVYDIVIVDEAHEHNTNMDLILTAMRNVLLNNNSVKLVIISATMDDDEPVYRRYYRDINDNLMYPIDTRLEKYNLDRINIDRRLHISPPGQTTRFKIDEIYVPGEDPHNIVIKIANSTSFGDILLFQPGEADIANSVSELNKKLPPNTIALPYFSSMHKDKKDEIENIHKMKDKIVVAKDADYKYFTFPDDGENRKKVPAGKYSRVVIVATNIAEASITISSLRYVVDTGTQKIGLYDPFTGDNSLVLIPISESSRLQRKGRVGRVASGTVYYMYPKGARADVKTPFNISVADISDNLYSSMRESFLDTKKIPNLTAVTNLSDVNDGMKLVFETHFFKNGKKVSYVGNLLQYDYENTTYPPSSFSTGFSMKTLTDRDGNFYIVHPEERSIIRNIDGIVTGIIGTSDVKIVDGKIISVKMESFWTNLQEMLLVFLSQDGEIKTEYGLNLSRLKESIKAENVRPLIAYIFSRQYGSQNDMLKLLPAVEMAIGSKITPNRWSMSYINEAGKYRTTIDIVRSIYGGCSGDVFAILNIINRFLDHFNIFTTIPTNKNRVEIEKQKKSYLDFMAGRVGSMDPEIYEKFRDLDIKRKLSKKENVSDAELNELVKNDINIDMIKELMSIEEDKIKTWCASNYIEYRTITMWITSYFRFYNQIYKKLSGAYDVDNLEKNMDVPMTWFDQKLKGFTASTKEESIILPLIHAYGGKICRNIDRSRFYFNLKNPAPEFITSIKTLSRYTTLVDTLVNEECRQNYLLYFGKDIDTNSIHTIQKVTPELLQRAALFVYTPMSIKEKFRENYHKMLVEQATKSLDTDRKVEIVDRYIHTLNKTRTELLNAYNPKVWDKLLNLFNENSTEYKSIKNLIEREKIISIEQQTGGNLKSDFIYNDFIRYIAGLS